MVGVYEARDASSRDDSPLSSCCRNWPPTVSEGFDCAAETSLRKKRDRTRYQGNARWMAAKAIEAGVSTSWTICGWNVT
jgi:hypothetical protein